MAAFCLLVHDKVTMESWYYMKDVVLEGGIPFKKAQGMTAFEHHGSDPRFNKLFNDSMRNHSTILIKQLLETYCGFDDVKVLVDVGGGTGATLNMITSRHPHIKGINFDLPLVIASAPTNPGSPFISDSVTVIVPTSYKVNLQCILHNWTNEQCARILKNCWKALPEEGKVIVVEYLLPVILKPDSRSQGIFPLDIGMMIHTGGRERTQEEFEAMAKEAGSTGFKATYISLAILGFWGSQSR
ncbi:caffeic acid [Musa troglodytarum]|uniref:Caffeic acid n=1 Tax=Musa troglodytarum TaxID=320322 RepID=A0A9E7F2L5_9LILI|nr:caffeic acid [Musa troglodytarum]